MDILQKFHNSHGKKLFQTGQFDSPNGGLMPITNNGTRAGETKNQVKRNFLQGTKPLQFLNNPLIQTLLNNLLIQMGP